MLLRLLVIWTSGGQSRMGILKEQPGAVVGVSWPLPSSLAYDTSNECLALDATPDMIKGRGWIPVPHGCLLCG